MIMKFYVHKNEWLVILPYTMSNHKKWNYGTLDSNR